jgi:ectoine hydroxylase-related dioxygenase (phytanoyl-CoA dioxygenase family)
MKPYLQIAALNRLMRHERILDAVEDLIGPNILVWAMGRFDKRPRDPGYVSWHQDGTYWGLSEPAVVNAWIALTPSNRRNGCMRVMPGSHHAGLLPHRDTFAENNLLSRGQDVAVEVDATQAVDLELVPGEISLHHVMTVHGSEPNRSDMRRCGIPVRYVATRVRPTAGFKDSATLVRGVDDHGHFIAEPTPSRDFDPNVVAFYQQIVGELRRRKEQLAVPV